MEDELHEPILPVLAPAAASLGDLGRLMNNLLWHAKAGEPPVELPTPVELGEDEEKKTMRATILKLRQQLQLAQVEANRESVEATP
eukprot:10485345-Heterocapsa_arctica.AAC.1